MTLTEYTRKRQFNRTAEPDASPRAKAGGRPIFVVQLHHASHRHYDFRLQVGPVLRSWAVPKGPSFDPSVKRLAAEVEDHPLAYAGFEGVIAEGQYGAGHVAIFDEGVWSTAEDAQAQLRKGHLRFELFGTKLKGGWHLIRTRRSSGKPQWLLVKEQDRYAGPREADDLLSDLPAPTAGASALRASKRKAADTDSVRRRSPSALATTKQAATRQGAPKAAPRAPSRARVDWAKRALALEGARAAKMPATAPGLQLATLVATAPSGPQWLHEIKWDGYRISAMIRAGQVSLWSRNGLDWTAKLPDIVAALEQLRLKDAVFDGELIAGQGSKSDFNLLQATLSGERSAALTYVLFDLLHVDGVALVRCRLSDRKTLLQQLLTKPPRHLAYSAHVVADVAEAFALAAQKGFEGIISKRADHAHSAGRGGDWTKSKQLDSGEFAVVGVTPPKGARAGFGALLLARHDARRGWIYAGKVGSGFSDQQLSELTRRIGKDGTATPSVSVPHNDTDLRSARWFKPKFLVEVHSRGLGSSGLLRQPSLKSVRLDKSVSDLVTREPNKSSPKTSSPGSAKKVAMKSNRTTARFEVSHPERLVYPDDGYTKQQVADYYSAVMEHLLPGIRGRPLSLIRCPSGISGQCFFQKHEISGVQGVDRVRLKEGSGVRADYLVVNDASAVMELVQFNALEFHPWGATAAKPDDCDVLVFDLDPGPGTSWNDVRSAARQLRDLLAQTALKSFLRTSGGKGLHVVVPLAPAVSWARAKRFAQAFAETVATMEPDKFVATASKAKREGRIFIDWLRNARGATSVASYSLRARAGAPVATPLRWEELGKVSSASMFDIRNVPKRLSRLRADPWAGFASLRQGLPQADGRSSDKARAKTHPARRRR